MALQLKPLQIDKKDIDRKQLAEVRRRFMAINKHRIARIREDSGRNLKNILDAIPVLLHVNHPALPGYLSQHTPCAISDYAPSKVQITSTRKISRSFNYEKKARLKREIYSVFLMGSMGTLGQSNESDLDIWVVHQPDLDAKALKALQKKLSAIEKWAADHYVQLHFFLMPPDYFKQQQENNLDKENCGSTQHLLLLEEFYRTALLLAGRFPLWWLVPPQEEDNYESFANHLIEKRFLRAGDWVDFGGVPKLPVEEYFGAALWHLNKAIDSPYKSSMKMMLMEAYAASYPRLNPVCLQFKINVFNGLVDDLNIDPYALILSRIETSLTDTDEAHRIEWLRKCLYLKVGKKLSIKSRSTTKQWRRNMMQGLVKQWGWDSVQLKQLDNRKKWKISRTIEERKAVIRELTQSYRLMSQFARKHGASLLISSEDMSILGRKLQANFERRAEKIERINPGISPDISEREMTLCEVLQVGKPSSWSLFVGKLNDAQVKREKPIYSHKELLGVLSWAYINQILVVSTQIQILGKNGLISASHLKQLLRMLKQEFPIPKVSADMEAYEQLAFYQKSFYVINLCSDSIRKNNKRNNQGLNLVSSRNDPLAFGSQRENLIFSIDVLSLNSWHEISYRRYSGDSSVLRLLQDAFSKNLDNPNWEFSLRNDSGANARNVEERLNQLICEILKIKQHHIPARFVWYQGNYFQLLGITENVIEPCMFDSEKELLQVLSYPEKTAQFVHTRFDQFSSIESPLSLVAQAAEPGKLKLYFYSKKSHLKIWLCDEVGAIGYGEQLFDDKQALLRTYQIFLSSIAQRQKIANPEQFLYQVEYFDLSLRQGTWKAKSIPMSEKQLPLHFYPVQALIEDVDNDGRISDLKAEQISIYCGDNQFNGITEGEQIFKTIAEYVKDQRKGKGEYPIYITDLDLDLNISSIHQYGHCSTLRYLEYKWQLEKQLNQAIE